PPSIRRSEYGRLRPPRARPWPSGPRRSSRGRLLLHVALHGLHQQPERFLLRAAARSDLRIRDGRGLKEAGFVLGDLDFESHRRLRKWLARSVSFLYRSSIRAVSDRLCLIADVSDRRRALTG